MNVEKWHHSEIRIAINDESKGSITTNLRCDELHFYTFIIHSAGKMVDCHTPHSPCTFVLKHADLVR